MKYEKIYGLILAVSVISIVIFALVLPMRGLRKNMLDSQIVRALSTVQIATESYISKKGEVPKNVSDLNFETGSKPSSKTLKRISIKEDDGSYQLCATFYTDTKKDINESTSSTSNLLDMAKSYTSSYDNYGNYDVHGAGNYCFSNIDPYSADMPTDNYYDSNYNNFGSSVDYYNTSLLASSDKSGRDTKRLTDIKSMHSQLEAYFAQNGSGYPALTDFNTVSWRAINMKGLDDISLCDPSASSQVHCVLVSAPQSKVYSYQTWEDDGTTVCKAKNDQGCPKYTLTVTLESSINGSSTYVKKSLN
ncbi:MAG: hypothetical protein WCP03_00985 [Candidatus Saccharibacteria bacterium]